MSRGKGTFHAGVLDLSVVVPKLPKVRFPSGNEVQLEHFTPQGYEMFRRLRRLHNEFVQGSAGSADEVEELLDLIDETLRLVLPTASEEDLASLGMRMEARTAPIFAVAGEVDHVIDMLVEASGSSEESEEGKAAAG